MFPCLPVDRGLSRLDTGCKTQERHTAAQQKNKEETAEKSFECCYLLNSKEKQPTPAGADLTFQSRNFPTKSLFLVLPSAGRSSLSAQPSREETLVMAASAKVRQGEAAVYAFSLLPSIQ